MSRSSPSEVVGAYGRELRRRALAAAGDAAGALAAAASALLAVLERKGLAGLPEAVALGEALDRYQTSGEGDGDGGAVGASAAGPRRSPEEASAYADRLFEIGERYERRVAERAARAASGADDPPDAEIVAMMVGQPESEKESDE